MLDRGSTRSTATGRWALLKLVTGSLRIGVSARLAKTALAEWSGVAIDRIEEVWHGMAPPYQPLFDWLEGRGPPPETGDLPTFYPLMLAQPLEDGDLAGLDPRDYLAEWKWDGIRVQLVARGGERRLYSRSGRRHRRALSPRFSRRCRTEVTLDGELLVMRDGEVAPFNDLQQRLNRKTPNPKLLRDYPAAVRLYDMLARRRRGSARPVLRRAPASARIMVCAARARPRSICRRWCRSRAGTSCASCATARASAASRG